jgi:hypothetical protein
VVAADQDDEGDDMTDANRTGDNTTGDNATRRSWGAWLNRWAGLIALPVALLALLVSGWAAIRPVPAAVSAPAVTTTASVPADAPARTTQPTIEPTTTTGPALTTEAPVTDTGAVDSSTLPPAGGQYVGGIADRELTLNPGSVRFVDLDAGTVGAEAGSEIRYYYGGVGNSPAVHFQTGRLASTTNPKITPGECAERIQTAPIAQDVTVAKDQVFCVVTDGRGATGDAIRVKIAVVLVRNIDRTGAITVSVSNWEAP